MRTNKLSILPTLLLLLGVGGLERAQALTLDWSQVTWTGSSLTGSFDLDGDSVNDVTITFSDPNGYIQNAYPREDDGPRGGHPNGYGSLQVSSQFTSSLSEIGVTVTFQNPLGVYGVSLEIYDIDLPGGGQPDQVRSVIGLYGTNVVAGTITGSSQNTVTGSGTNVMVTGTGSSGTSQGDGNATISFGTNVITSYSFTYGLDTNASGSGGAIDFWFGRMDFTKKIPEAGVPVGFSLGCLGLVGISLGRRWKNRQRGVLLS